MRRAKYLLFLLVLTAAVFGLAAVASAAVFSDVKGTKYQTAVDALSQLGIVTGYPDGTIKPDQTITRAEFCAIAVRELGLSADVAPMGTQFSDVTASHWASGLINVAVGQGLVKGYPDGTFKPENPVTYAEAITILVRMLGYGPAMDESAWPAPYLAKAAQIGVTNNVSVKPGDPAPRGDVFLMAYNSLDADVMKQTGWGTEIKYEESDNFKDTILSDKLNIKRVGNEDYPAVVEAAPFTDVSLDKDTLRVVDTYPARYDPSEYNELDGGSYECIEGINPNDYLGYEVELWVDDATDKVVWVRVHTDASDIINDVVDDVEYDADGNVTSFTFKKSGKEYNLADSVIAYMNMNRVGHQDADGNWKIDRNMTWSEPTKATDPDRDSRNVAGFSGVSYDAVSDFFGRSVKAVLNDEGEIAFIECYKGNSGVVTEVDVEDKEIRFFWTDESERTLDLSDNDDYVLYRDGKLATLADIQKGDLINVYPDVAPFDGIDPGDEDDIRLIKVSSAKVTGTLDAVDSEGAEVDDYYVEVKGTKYPIIGNIYEDEYYINAIQTVSFDNNDEVEVMEPEDLEDLLGEEVTLYLIGNNVRHIEASTEAAGAEDIYAILTGADWDPFDDLRFKVVNKNGDDVTYEATDDTEYYEENNALGGRDEAAGVPFNGSDYDMDTGARDTNGDGVLDTCSLEEALAGKTLLIKIELDNNGKVAELHVLADVDAAAQSIRIDENARRARVNGTSYPVEEWAALFDAIGTGIDDTSWGALQDTQDDLGATPFTGFAYVDNDKIVALVVNGPAGTAITTERQAGIVVSRQKISDGYKFGILVNGETVYYNTESDSVADDAYIGDNEGTFRSGQDAYINRGDVVEFTLNADNEIDWINELFGGTTVSGVTYERFIVTDVDADDGIIKVRLKDPVSGAQVGNEITYDVSSSSDPDEKTYVFDYTDATPKLIELADVSTGDEVHIFLFGDRATGDAEPDQVQFIKVVD